MRPILILTVSLAANGLSAQAGPSFDCARADGAAQTLVCEDAGLAAMDREIARLYRLAVEGSHMTPNRLRDLRAYQRGWIKRRDDCSKATDLVDCVRFASAERIHGLRQGYADARAHDDAGTSHGPFPVLCEDLDAIISATFVGGPGAVAYLEWRGEAHVLTATPVASGAAYAGDGLEFRMKGEDAVLAREGAARACRFDDSG